MKKSFEDKIVDDLLKAHEEVDKYKKFSHKASGLASFLTSKSEEELILEDLKFRVIPNILAKLNELKTFYDNKKEYNDNSRILKKEIEFSLKSLDEIENVVPLQYLKELENKFNDMAIKYGL